MSTGINNNPPPPDDPPDDKQSDWLTPYEKSLGLDPENLPLGWNPISEDINIYPPDQVPPPDEPRVIDPDNPSGDDDDISDMGFWLEYAKSKSKGEAEG